MGYFLNRPLYNFLSNPRRVVNILLCCTNKPRHCGICPHHSTKHALLHTVSELSCGRRQQRRSYFKTRRFPCGFHYIFHRRIIKCGMKQQRIIVRIVQHGLLLSRSSQNRIDSHHNVYGIYVLLYHHLIVCGLYFFILYMLRQNLRRGTSHYKNRCHYGKNHSYHSLSIQNVWAKLNQFFMSAIFTGAKSTDVHKFICPHT